MKKRTWIYALIVVCLISISANALFVIGSYNAKKTFLDGAYYHLVNINQIIDNFTHSITTGNDTLNYNYSVLNEECLKFDGDIYGLRVISSRNSSVTYYFADFYKSILSVIQVNSDNPEKAINDLMQYQEKLLNLIAQLSPDGELQYSEYGNGILLRTPNYSLGGKHIISLVNSAFADQNQRTFHFSRY